MRLSNYYNEETGDLKVGKILFQVIGLIVLLSVVGWGLHLILLPAKTVTGVVEKTLDSNNVIYNYEWFKQSWKDYGAITKKIETAEEAAKNFNKEAGPRDKWTFEDKTEYARLNAISQGLKNQRNDLVATYNARSKMVNRNIFKGSDVPPELE